MKLFKKLLRINGIALTMALASSFPSSASNGAGTEPPKVAAPGVDVGKSQTLCDYLPVACELILTSNSNGAGTEPPN